MMRTIAAVLISAGLLGVQAAKAPSQAPSPLQVKTVLQTDKAWDGSQYTAYPAGHPQLSVLQITIPPRTTMEWHRHPVPNAAYVVSGELNVETQAGHKVHFTKGQVIAETVGVWHRGVTGDQAADLLVFYAGAPGVPLSEAESKAPAK
jgi:quercetin dioxygenase-like cupin family protein